MVLPDRTRVDCLNKTYAIEIDFAKKWAEGIGQALYYAKRTGKKPAVALIVDLDSDIRYIKRLETVSRFYGIRIFLIEKE